MIEPFVSRLEKLVGDFLAEFVSASEILMARGEAAEAMSKLAAEMRDEDREEDDGQPSEQGEWRDFDLDC